MVMLTDTIKLHYSVNMKVFSKTSEQILENISIQWTNWIQQIRSYDNYVVLVKVEAVNPKKKLRKLLSSRTVTSNRSFSFIDVQKF